MVLMSIVVIIAAILAVFFRIIRWPKVAGVFVFIVATTIGVHQYEIGFPALGIAAATFGAFALVLPFFGR